MLRPFFGNDAKLGTCPSDLSVNAVYVGGPYNFRMGYGSNCAGGANAFTGTLTDSGPGYAGVVGATLTHVKAPSECFSIGDSTTFNPYADGDQYRYIMWYRWLGLDNNPNPRHNGGANFSFCDGHVQWLGYADAVNARTNRRYIDNVAR